jgi:hypothetical protein
VGVATAALDKRLDAMNEFRASLQDQNQKFISKDFYETEHKSLSRIVDVSSTRLYELEKTVSAQQLVRAQHREGVSQTAMWFAMAGVIFSVACSVVTVAFNLLAYIRR